MINAAIVGLGGWGRNLGNEAGDPLNNSTVLGAVADSVETARRVAIA